MRILAAVLAYTSAMRIAIATPSLRRDGGVERITALLANALAGAGHDVTMVTRYPTTDNRQKLHEAVEDREMYVPRGPKPLRNAQLAFVVRSLRKAFAEARPDVVIGSRWDCAILSLLATRRSSVPTIAWEHGHLPLAHLTPSWKALRARHYPNAAAVVLVNEASRPAAEQLVRADRITVIHNFLGLPRESSEASASAVPSLWRTFPGGRPSHGVVGIGRLEHEKGFDRLLDAFARIAAAHPEWGLLIAGRGSMQNALQRQARRLGLQGRIHLAGWTEDPTPTLSESDVFVLPSRFEGFGIALIEAMAAGVPVVAFDCPAGPREIVRHGTDGILVPDGDVNALSQALAQVMSDPARRAALAKEAPRRVAERFSQERALLAWSELLTRVVQARPPVDDRARR